MENKDLEIKAERFMHATILSFITGLVLLIIAALLHCVG